MQQPADGRRALKLRLLELDRRDEALVSLVVRLNGRGRTPDWELSDGSDVEFVVTHAHARAPAGDIGVIQVVDKVPRHGGKALAYLTQPLQYDTVSELLEQLAKAYWATRGVDGGAASPSGFHDTVAEASRDLSPTVPGDTLRRAPATPVGAAPAPSTPAPQGRQGAYSSTVSDGRELDLPAAAPAAPVPAPAPAPAAVVLSLKRWPPYELLGIDPVYPRLAAFLAARPFTLDQLHHASGAPLALCKRFADDLHARQLLTLPGAQPPRPALPARAPSAPATAASPRAATPATPAATGTPPRATGGFIQRLRRRFGLA